MNEATHGTSEWPVIETARLRLRPLGADDEPSFVAFYGDPEVMAIRKFGVMDAARARAAFETLRAHWSRHGFGLFAVTVAGSGEFGGECGLRWLEDGSDVELSYGLLPAHRGLGYATEASRAMLRHGFGALGLARIVALSRGDNRVSHRVLEKCGMRLVERIDRGPHGVVRYAIDAPGR